MKAWMVIVIAAALVVSMWLYTTSQQRTAEIQARAKVQSTRIANPPKPLF